MGGDYTEQRRWRSWGPSWRLPVTQAKDKRLLSGSKEAGLQTQVMSDSINHAFNPVLAPSLKVICNLSSRVYQYQQRLIGEAEPLRVTWN